MKLKHPESGVEVDAREDHVDTYKSQGFEPVEDAKSNKADKKS